MGILLGLGIYFIIWWTVLFAVLPLGVRTQGEDGVVVRGTPESAPSKPRLLRIIAITTILATVVFAAVYAAVESGWIDLDSLRVAAQKRAG
jgi:predicted secreted protein